MAIIRHVLMDGSVVLLWLDGPVLKDAIEQMVQAVTRVLRVGEPENNLAIAGSF